MVNFHVSNHAKRVKRGHKVMEMVNNMVIAQFELSENVPKNILHIPLYHQILILLFKKNKREVESLYMIRKNC